MAKVDQLLDLASRALVVQGQMGAGLLDTGGANDDLLELHQKGERLLLELQDWIIDTRMIPVSTSFVRTRGPYATRLRAQRKRARLRIEGERVRVDTSIGEGARDVLTHLVRNAIDHGIELPGGADRQRQGPRRHSHAARGAERQPGGDPGGGRRRGVQPVEDPRARAHARPPNVDSLAAQDLHQLVFEAGFSTADKVTELSGRGVGMDVVRRNGSRTCTGRWRSTASKAQARRSSCGCR